jgi:hypothetical protein
MWSLPIAPGFSFDVPAIAFAERGELAYVPMSGARHPISRIVRRNDATPIASCVTRRSDVALCALCALRGDAASRNARPIAELLIGNFEEAALGFYARRAVTE